MQHFSSAGHSTVLGLREIYPFLHLKCISESKGEKNGLSRYPRYAAPATSLIKTVQRFARG